MWLPSFDGDLSSSSMQPHTEIEVCTRLLFQAIVLTTCMDGQTNGGYLQFPFSFRRTLQTGPVLLNKEFKVSPGHLLPLLDVSVPEGQLVQLREQVVGNVLLIVILRPEDELDPLRWRV